MDSKEALRKTNLRDGQGCSWASGMTAGTPLPSKFLLTVGSAPLCMLPTSALTADRMSPQSGKQG